MMKRLLIYIIGIYSCLATFAENFRLDLYPVEQDELLFKLALVRWPSDLWHAPDFKIWRRPGDSTLVDSVRYPAPCLTGYVKRKDNGMEYVVSHRLPTGIFYTDTCLYVPMDTLASWRKAKKAIYKRIGFIWKGDERLADYELILNPYHPVFNFNDLSLADFFWGHSVLRTRQTELNGNTLCVRKSYPYPESEDVVVFDETGKKHVRERQKRYPVTNLSDRYKKDSYSAGDTIPLGQQYYRVDSISRAWDALYLTEVNVPEVDLSIIPKLPEDVLQTLRPYFAGRKYLLADFWGTWCAPCIAGFPKMKLLYQHVRERVSMVGICNDEVGNKNKMLQILEKQGIEWPNLLDDMTSVHSLAVQLKISVFPTYLLINDKGNILFMDYGIAGFQALQEKMKNIIVGH